MRRKRGAERRDMEERRREWKAREKTEGEERRGKWSRRKNIREEG